MTAQVQIPDLSPAGPIQPTDLILLRQGIVDVKATVAQISQIIFSTYTISATPLSATDVLVFGKNNGDGTYSNYALNPQQIGFLENTITWFYQSTAPLGWQIVPGTGDRILGTVLTGGGVNTYNATGLQGTWQQRDVSGEVGNGLTVTQIPNHQHWGQWGQDQSDSKPSYLRGNRSLPTAPNPRYTTSAILGIVGGAGDVPSHDAFGVCDPHNHGNNWRPAATIGIICRKIA